MENWLIELLTGLLAFGLVYVAVKIDRKHGHLTPYEKRMRKKWETEKAAEEAAKQAESEPQKPQHFITQMEYDRYKREHGIK